jgi:hypothetical protein
MALKQFVPKRITGADRDPILTRDSVLSSFSAYTLKLLRIIDTWASAVRGRNSFV